ncbi:MAG: hypothetical protein SFW66_06540 [Gammaproteobacteria bacterium]|nr:hypothetical protein [Gammaproteobacteria bacterium]
MRILILGDKDSVVRDEFKRGNVLTIGIDFVKQGDHQLWWTAAGVRSRHITKSQVQDVDAVVAIVKMDDQGSFSDVKEWVKSIENIFPECKIFVMCLHPEDKSQEIVFKSEVDAWVETCQGKVDVIDHQVSQYETKPDKHPIIEWADKQKLEEEKEIVQPPEPKKSRIAMPQFSLPRISLFGESKQEGKIEQGLSVVKLKDVIESERIRVADKLEKFSKQALEEKERSKRLRELEEKEPSKTLREREEKELSKTLKTLQNNIDSTSKKLVVLHELNRALEMRKNFPFINHDELERICAKIPNFSAINVFDEGTAKHISGKTTLCRNLEKAFGSHKDILSDAIKRSEIANQEAIKAQQARQKEKAKEPKVYQYGATDDAAVVPSAPIERVSEDKHFVGEVEPSAPPAEVSAQPINYAGDDIPPIAEAPHSEQEAEAALPESEPRPPAYGADAQVADEENEIADFPEVPKYTPKFFDDNQDEEPHADEEANKKPNKPIIQN